MAHIPDQAIIGRIKYIVQGNCQLGNAEPSTKVAASFTHAIEHKRAQLISYN